jgi:hypothetical protein
MDGRDIDRLADYIPEDRLSEMGVTLKDEYRGKHKARALSREEALDRLKSDLAFAFEKAIDQRGISASCMYHVVLMWNWVLDEGLESFNDYGEYGLPLLKATAAKYGFPDPTKD